MYRFFVIIFIIFFFTNSLASNHKIYALTLNEIEPPNYLQLFSELESQYFQVPVAEINAIPETDRPTSSDMEILESRILDLQSNCQSLINSSSTSGNIGMYLEKFKRIERLIDSITKLETEINQYLTHCREENDYQRSLQALSDFIKQNNSNPVFTNILSGNVRCGYETAQNLSYEQKTQTENYSTARKYMDQSVNLYNEKSVRYNELENNIASVSEENLKLGEKSGEIIQRLNFLTTRIKSEQQELELIDSELKRDYQALSQQNTIEGEDIQTFLSDTSENVAFSLDKKHTWYAFDNHADLLKFLKLLKASNNEVRLIQGKALTILDKKQTLSQLFAEKLSNTMVLNFTENEIEKNTSLIAKHNEEQQAIKPRLDQYKNLAESRRSQDRVLRDGLAKFTSALELCSEQMLEDFQVATQDLDKLNEDILLEFERQYTEKYSKQEFDDSRGAESLALSNPGKLSQIIVNYKEILPRFVDCRQSDQLSIKTNSSDTSSTIINGIANFNITVTDREDQNNIIASIESSYNAQKPLDHMDINHFINYLSKELLVRPALLTGISSGSDLTIIPSVWSQELKTIEDTYKLYECRDKSWTEISSRKEYVMELGNCNTTTIEPIIVPVNTENLSVNQTLITEIQTFVQNNQTKVYGSCNY